MKRLLILVLVMICSITSCGTTSAVEAIQMTTYVEIISTTTNSYMVYITDTGEKYHRDDCGCLWNSKHSISIEDAQARGYSACKLCNP